VDSLIRPKDRMEDGDNNDIERPQGEDNKDRESDGGSPRGGGRSRSGSRDRKRSRSHSPARHSRRSRSRDSRSRSRSRRSRSRSGGRRDDRNKYTLDKDGGNEGYRLHVADLDRDVRRSDLERLFGKFGPLKEEIWIANSVPCFAFVVFQYKEDAEEAQRKSDSSEVCGRRIRVTVARPRNLGRGGPRRMSRSRSRDRDSRSPRQDRMVTMDEAGGDEDRSRGEDNKDRDSDGGKDRKRRHSSDSSRGGRRSRSRSKSRDRKKSRSRSPARRRRSRSRDSRSRSRSGGRGGRGGGNDWTFDDHNDEDGYRLHVADLDSNAGKRDLEKLFGKYGPLKEIWMARSVPCFAFVVYRYREDAEEGQRKADGSEVCGRRIRVTIARPRTRGRGRRGFDPGMRCYQCGERGHFSRDCPDSKWGYKRPPSPRRSRDEGRDRRRF